jgi:hypothetical protein
MSDDSDDEVEVEELEQHRICSDCIGESYLRAEIQRSGQDDTCSYCEEDGKTISLVELADHVGKAFEQHYHRTATEPDGIEYLVAKEGGGWERHGEQASYAIAEAAQIDDEVAEHVRRLLYERGYDFDDVAAGEESEFDQDAYYEESDIEDYELQAKWQYFQESLKTESRHFNRAAEATLDSIFEDLEAHKTSDGKTAIVQAGPDLELKALYRARVFQSAENLKKALARPDTELGPPPSRLAVAGRMSAQGIAVFYGATNPDVALAETRPPVGSRVADGRFEIVRPLRLLDIEVLRSLFVDGSIFDPTYLGRLEKAKFLRTVSHRISEPVMPDDEPFEYIVTQAIADYLAGRREPPIDGIIYPSVQSGAGKMNVVLFHKAARVENMDISPGTEIQAYLEQHDEDGSSPDYRVFEDTPPKEAEESEDDDFLLPVLQPILNTDADARNVTLRLDVKSIRVHHIQNVTYGKESFDVQRHRTEKRKGGC